MNPQSMKIFVDFYFFGAIKHMTQGTSMYEYFLVAQILNDDLENGIKTYFENFDLLYNYNFVFVSNDGQEYFKKEKSKLKDFNVTSLFCSDHLYFLRKETIFASMRNDKKYRDKILTLISLDTQILSYIYRASIGQHNSIPESTYEILKMIKQRKYGVDYRAYVLENGLFNEDFISTEIYKENILAFEKIILRNENKAKQYSEQVYEADKQFFNSHFANHNRRLYKLIYLSLLFMVDAQLNHKELTVTEKEEKMFSFFDTRIGLVPEREIN